MLSGVYYLDNKLSVPLDWPPELIVSDKSTEMTVSPSSVDGFFHEEVADSLDKHADQEKFLTDVTQYISYISHGIEKHLDPLVKSRYTYYQRLEEDCV